jgi:hypothetical protein
MGSSQAKGKVKRCQRFARSKLGPRMLKDLWDEAHTWRCACCDCVAGRCLPSRFPDDACSLKRTSPRGTKSGHYFSCGAHKPQRLELRQIRLPTPVHCFFSQTSLKSSHLPLSCHARRLLPFASPTPICHPWRLAASFLRRVPQDTAQIHGAISHYRSGNFARFLPPSVAIADVNSAQFTAVCI